MSHLERFHSLGLEFLLGVVSESPMMSPGSHCDTPDNKPFGCSGKPQKATLSGLLCWGQTSTSGGKKGPPFNCVLLEGTEKICWTRTLTGPGVLVLICHALRLWLHLLRDQKSLSQLPSSCMHNSERSVTILPQELEHAKTPQCHSAAPGQSMALVAAEVLS